VFLLAQLDADIEKLWHDRVEARE
jgi:hypothetical protein